MLSRKYGAMVALFSVLAGASASAQTPPPLDSTTSTTDGTTAAESAPSDTEDDRPPRDHTYSLGVTLATSRFRAQDGTRMGMLAPGLTVNYTVGRTFGFGLRASIAFPMHGRQSNADVEGSVNLIDLYDEQRLSFDGTFMFVYRMRPSDTLDLVFGAGIHIHTFRLVDSTAGGSQHDPVELITGGFGGVARVEKRLSNHFFLSGELAAAIDPLDFIRHVNRAVFVAPVALSFAVGARR